MAHDDALLPQALSKRRTTVLRVASKEEIGRRRQTVEAAQGELLVEPVTLADYLFTALLEPCLILECGHTGGDSQAIQRIGIEAVLDAVQTINQRLIAHGQTDTQTGQGTGLGQGLGDQQIRVAVDQADGRIATEVDVGFVNHHQGFCIGLQETLDIAQRH